MKAESVVEQRPAARSGRAVRPAAWALLVFALAAVPSLGADVELDVFAWTRADPIFTQVFAMFAAENPHIAVNDVTGAGNQFDQILTLVAAGTPPDVIITTLGFYMPLAGAGILDDIAPRLELDPEFAALRDGLYVTLLRQFSTERGELYAFPLDINLRMLFYNRDHFNQAGLPFPTDGWRFDEFVDTARRLTRLTDDGAVERYGFTGFAGPPSAWITWVRAGGGQMFDRSVDPTRSTVSAPETLQVLHTLVAMIHSYNAAPPPAVAAPFQQQRSSMGLLWVEDTYNLERLEGLDYAMVPQPSIDQRYSAMGVRFVGIVKGSPQADEAYTLAKYMSTNPAAQRLLGERKVSWVRDVATDPDILETPPGRNRRSVLNAIEFAEVIYPLTSAWNRVEPLLNQHVQAALNNQVSVEAAAQELDRILPPILQGE